VRSDDILRSEDGTTGVRKQDSPGRGGSYREILSNPRARTPFLFSLLAKLPISTVPLGLMMATVQQRDSYALAGLMSGSYAVGTALGGPNWGRALDKYGHSRPIALASTLCAVLIATMTGLIIAGAPSSVLIPGAALTGATFPPVSAAMRAGWRIVFPEERHRHAGYALDGASGAVLFIVGPLLVSLAMLFVKASAALVLVSLTLFLGGLGYSRTWVAREAGVPEPASGTGAGPRRMTGGLFVLLTGMTTFTAGMGAYEVTLAACAEPVLGDEALVGMLFAATSVGSMIGGIWYGTGRLAMPLPRRLPVALAALALGWAPVPLLLLWDGAPAAALVGVLALTGFAIGPIFLVFQALADTMVSPDRRNEAQGWLAAATTTGNAVGTACAGVLTDAGGAAWSSTATLVVLLSASLLAAGAQGRLRATAERFHITTRVCLTGAEAGS
jgi:MFS family permease